MKKKLKVNSIKCLECGEVLASRHRHDYKTCGCPNNAMVDGGYDYRRYGAKDMDLIKCTPVYVSIDTVLWGRANPAGGHDNLELHEIEDDHLCNIAWELKGRFPDNLEELYKHFIFVELRSRGLEVPGEMIPWS